MRKNIYLTILGVLVAGVVFAQQKETRNLSNFVSVSTGQSIDVVLKKGSENTATISASGVELNEVRTEVTGGRLKIRLKDGNYRKKINVKVVVTYTELNSVSASSSGSITSDDVIKTSGEFSVGVSSSGSVFLNKIIADRMDLSASSSGKMKLSVDVADLEASASSSGKIKISGKVNQQEIMVSSSGDFIGEELYASSAEVRASSSGYASVKVDKKLRARASSGG